MLGWRNLGHLGGELLDIIAFARSLKIQTLDRSQTQLTAHATATQNTTMKVAIVITALLISSSSAFMATPAKPATRQSSAMQASRKMTEMGFDDDMWDGVDGINVRRAAVKNTRRKAAGVPKRKAARLHEDKPFGKGHRGRGGRPDKDSEWDDSSYLNDV